MEKDNDYKIASQTLLGISPSIMDSIKASMEAIDTINTSEVFSLIDNIDLDSIESAQQSFAQLNTMDDILENMRNQLRAMGSMRNSIDEIATMGDIIGNSIERIATISQIDIPDFSSQISSLLSTIDLDSLSRQYSWYNKLDNLEEELNDILVKYQWFVLPEMPLAFIIDIVELSKMENPRKMINQHFFGYFAYNNFQSLRELVEKWESSRKFRPGRLKIIKDCLNTMINAENGKIPSTLIVPTLIAQIDGIQSEFLLNNNFKYDVFRFEHEITGKKMKKMKAWKYAYEPEDVFSDIINDIILDVLFATAIPGKPIKTPINFSRHKIMHGERLDYGTKYNVIRTFLILDFLHDLL